MRPPVMCLVISIAAAAPLSAQPSDGAAPDLVAGGGLGAGTLGVAGHVYISAPAGPGDLVVRTSGTTEFEIMGNSDSSVDVAVLYGLSTRARTRPWVRVAAGFGRVHSVRWGGQIVERTEWSYRSYSEVEESDTMGLAFQLDLAWGLRRALGISLMGNVNSRSTYLAAALSLHVGLAG